MTAVAPAQTRATPAAPAYRLSFARVLRSEWIKLATLRSTWWSLGIAAVLTVGISLMIAAASAEFGGGNGFTAVMAITAPTQFTMLVAGILGAISVTGEYSTGMIRSTLTAQPHRGSVLAAKAVVVAALMALATVVTYSIAIVATAPLLGDNGFDWSDASVSVVPLGYGVLSMAVFALIGLSWGFIVRNGAGAIAATVGLLFVLPIVLGLFSIAGEGWRWIVDLGEYLPVSAAQQLTNPETESVLSPLLSLAGWVVAGMLGSWAVLRTRDA